MALKRPCDRCNKKFKPTTYHNRLCTKCRDMVYIKRKNAENI